MDSITDLLVYDPFIFSNAFNIISLYFSRLPVGVSTISTILIINFAKNVIKLPPEAVNTICAGC